MKAIIKTEKGISLKDVPVPSLKHATDVLIRVEVAGICRTDLKTANGIINVQIGLVLGHEFSGVIEKVGVAVRPSIIGKMVAINPLIACEDCPNCKADNSMNCLRPKFLGLNIDGAFSEYVVVSEKQVKPTRLGVTFQEAAYAEPVAAALGILNADIRQHHKGFIYGKNRFSFLLAKVLKFYGYESITIYDSQYRTDFQLHDYDFAIETFICDEAVTTMLQAIKPKGKIILRSRSHESPNLRMELLKEKSPILQVVNYGKFDEAVNILGKLDLKDLIGRGYPLEEFEEALKRARDDESQKILFLPQETLICAG